MQIKIFEVPAFDTSGAGEEMNRFLRGHKILNIEQQLVQSDNSSYWSFCIKYTDANTANTNFKESNRKDYKKELDEATFQRFSILRECRKQIAADMAVKIFMVFTDEELSEIAKMREIIPEKMVKIKGIGDKKVERYGHKLAEMFNQRITNETGQSPDK